MLSPPVTAAPRPATTVLLLRDEPQGFSVFMVQRSLEASFMPGAYVFPGGAVDPEDGADSARWGGIDPRVASERFEGELSPAAATAHLVAGAREVQEEAGVTLPSLGCLWPMAHWITPDFEPRRFDTWFLVGRMPLDAAPAHDAQETIASRWVEPRQALERYGDGDLAMAPPTWYTLWDIARFERAEDVLRDAARRSVPPVQPRFQQLGKRAALLLPGDPLYPSDRPVQGPTRVVMLEDGRWWAVDGAG